VERTDAVTRTKKTAKSKTKSRDAKVYCVVCPTWEIKHPERCSNTVVLSPRRTLYFCQRRCKDRYLKAPEAF
jgi:hypothetical protein